MFYFHVLLSCTAIVYCYHVLCSCTDFIYCIHVLFHVLFSYTVFLLYISYYFLFHVLYLFIYFSCTILYTFHILYSCTVSCTFQIILHSYTFSYIMSDCIISCYRTYHHIAVLCFLDHIISFHMSYSNHLFYVSCLYKP